MISGLQAAFLLFHNHAVDYVAERDRRASSDDVYREARRLTQWHYQWMIVHEFLPLFIGQRLVDDILQKDGNSTTPGRRSFPSSSRCGIPLWPHAGSPLVPGESER